MRSVLRNAAIALATAAMVLGFGCGSQRSAGIAQVGAVAVSALTTRADVARVSLTLTKVEGTWSNTFTLGNSRTDNTGAWPGLFQQIPVGTYVLYAKATDSSGNVLFDYTSDGGAPVVVSGNATTSMTLLLQEKQPKKPFANGAPYFVSLLASQASVDSSTTVQQAAVAADPDGDALKFAWTTGAGAALSGQVDTATTSAVSFKAAVDGDHVVTVKATDPASATAAVVTVDGLRVTVDYFASPSGCNGDCDETNDLIPYTFSKHETYGYGLNGKEYLVPQGGSYSVVDETFQGTRARS